MLNSRKQKWLALIAVPPLLLGLFVVGLFVYVNATARPLHPDPTAVSSVLQSAPARQWAAAVEQARQSARAGLIEKNCPGLSVAVGVGGDIVWAEGFGWADLEKRMPVAPVTRFRVGGASIPLTSAAVGMLIEKDQLHRDAEIQTYVASFPEKQWPVPVRPLLAHPAGGWGDGGDAAPLFSQRCEGTLDALPRFAERPLLFEPGTKRQYSTLGWILVSAAVESVAKEPFFAFMRTQIFKPLGMADTTPDSPGESVPDRATPYHPRFGGDPRYGPDLARDGGYSCLAGGGGFLSTPSDLVRFGMAVNGGKLLQPATVKLFQTSQRLASGEELGYGLGWDLETVSLGGASTIAIGHDSEFVMGGSASLMTFPDRGLVVAVATNTSFGDTAPIALKIAEAFAQHSPARK